MSLFIAGAADKIISKGSSQLKQFYDRAHECDPIHAWSHQDFKY